MLVEPCLRTAFRMRAWRAVLCFTAARIKCVPDLQEPGRFHASLHGSFMRASPDGDSHVAEQCSIELREFQWAMQGRQFCFHVGRNSFASRSGHAYFFAHEASVARWSVGRVADELARLGIICRAFKWVLCMLHGPAPAASLLWLWGQRRRPCSDAMSHFQVRICFAGRFALVHVLRGIQLLFSWHTSSHSNEAGLSRPCPSSSASGGHAYCVQCFRLAPRNLLSFNAWAQQRSSASFCHHPTSCCDVAGFSLCPPDFPGAWCYTWIFRLGLLRLEPHASAGLGAAWVRRWDRCCGLGHGLRMRRPPTRSCWSRWWCRGSFWVIMQWSLVRLWIEPAWLYLF